MLVEMTNFGTKETVKLEIEGLNVEELNQQFKSRFSPDELERIIANFDIPAEAKALLTELLNFSIKVGTAVLEVGKKIVEILKVLVKNFPHVTAGMIIAVTLSFLVSCIPILGPLLSWICTPLFLLIGVGAGVLKEVENTDLGKALKEVVDAIFAGLKRIPLPPVPLPI
jgi:hypothetical protein